ncbi:MAG: hypothetical protein SFW67_13005 [Myxococcaceae bacterium]|nr:hypothetical protein [Myxococcaceae bacterium]
MSIRSLGMPVLRADRLTRQASSPTTELRSFQRAVVDAFDAALQPQTRRQAVIGGGNGPINVGPVFGDTGLPAPKGIISPTGPNVNAPGVTAPVQDNTLAPKVPEAPPRGPAEPVNQNTQPPGPNDAQPPVQNTTPPVQNTTPPVQNTTPPVNDARPPVQENAAPGGPVAPTERPPTPQGPGAVDGVSERPGLDAQSLDELVTALVQVIDELVKQLAPGAATSPEVPTAPKAEQPAPTGDARAAASADSGLVSFSLRASAHFLISG